jgi:hypothetical protein
MQYALLIYAAEDAADQARSPVSDAVADVLARPSVTGWARLHAEGSATTLRGDAERTLSKEYLAGLVMVDAENLDEALAVAQDLQGTRSGGAIEVRPVVEGRFRAA